MVQLRYHLPRADFGPQHVEEPDLLQALRVRSVRRAWGEDLHGGGARNTRKLQPQHAHLRVAFHQHRSQHQLDLRRAGHVPPQPLRRRQLGRQVPGIHPQPGGVRPLRVLHLVVRPIPGQRDLHGKPRQHVREDKEEVAVGVQQGDGRDARGAARDHERHPEAIGNAHAAVGGWAAPWSDALDELDYFNGNPRDASEHCD